MTSEVFKSSKNSSIKRLIEKGGSGWQDAAIVWEEKEGRGKRARGYLWPHQADASGDEARPPYKHVF
jgi:hypothetical protein